MEPQLKRYYKGTSYSTLIETTDYGKAPIVSKLNMHLRYVVFKYQYHPLPFITIMKYSIPFFSQLIMVAIAKVHHPKIWSGTVVVNVNLKN